MLLVCLAVFFDTASRTGQILEFRQVIVAQWAIGLRGKPSQQQAVVPRATFLAHPAGPGRTVRKEEKKILCRLGVV